MQEILTFNEGKHSWFIDDRVKSDGKMHLSTPIDPIFLGKCILQKKKHSPISMLVLFFSEGLNGFYDCSLRKSIIFNSAFSRLSGLQTDIISKRILFFSVLPYLRKYCANQAVPLDQLLRDEEFPETERLLKSSGLKYLNLIADRKGDEELNAFKYNEEKTLSWLKKKTERVSEILKQKNIHVSSGAVSATFIKSSKDDPPDAEAYLRYAHGIVSEYLMDDLSLKLSKYLGLPEQSQVNLKRKSTSINQSDSKKVKNDEDTKSSTSSSSSSSSSVLDLSKPEPKNKQLAFTAKEKARAKAASGSKNIAAFFKKT